MSASARSGGAALFGAAALQIHRGFGRLGGCGEQRPLIALQEREPLRKLLRVVGPRFLRDPKLRAQERGADLGDEFLGGIGLIAKALAELAVKAVFRAGPVRQLVYERRVAGGQGNRLGHERASTRDLVRRRSCPRRE
jgi:hypothetical protein